MTYLIAIPLALIVAFAPISELAPAAIAQSSIEADVRVSGGSFASSAIINGEFDPHSFMTFVADSDVSIDFSALTQLSPYPKSENPRVVSWSEINFTLPELEPVEATVPKKYRGISEGDTIKGHLTHYCVCMRCCGKLDGITASGMKIKNGVYPDLPVASCNWLPLGTLIDINGVRHIVADRGGQGLSKIGRIDIFTPEGHQYALQKGRIYGASIVIVLLPQK